MEVETNGVFVLNLYLTFDMVTFDSYGNFMAIMLERFDTISQTWVDDYPKARKHVIGYIASNNFRGMFEQRILTLTAGTKYRHKITYGNPEYHPSYPTRTMRISLMYLQSGFLSVQSIDSSSQKYIHLQGHDGITPSNLLYQYYQLIDDMNKQSSITGRLNTFDFKELTWKTYQDNIGIQSDASHFTIDPITGRLRINESGTYTIEWTVISNSNKQAHTPILEYKVVHQGATIFNTASSTKMPTMGGNHPINGEPNDRNMLRLNVQFAHYVNANDTLEFYVRTNQGTTVDTAIIDCNINVISVPSSTSIVEQFKFKANPSFTHYTVRIPSLDIWCYWTHNIWDVLKSVSNSQRYWELENDESTTPTPTNFELHNDDGTGDYHLVCKVQGVYDIRPSWYSTDINGNLILSTPNFKCVLNNDDLIYKSKPCFRLCESSVFRRTS